jgi:hypothetical protein
MTLWVNRVSLGALADVGYYPGSDRESRYSLPAGRQVLQYFSLG